MSIFVRPFVCLAVRMTRKPHGLASSNVLCMLPVVMSQFSCDGVTICYVLPVLWMTSCFHTVGTVGQNQVWCYFSKKFTR